MHALLEYIKKDRFADPLVEKLCLRFDACDNDPRQWRNLAFCLAQAPPLLDVMPVANIAAVTGAITCRPAAIRDCCFDRHEPLLTLSPAGKPNRPA